MTCNFQICNLLRWTTPTLLLQKKAAYLKLKWIFLDLCIVNFFFSNFQELKVSHQTPNRKNQKLLTQRTPFQFLILLLRRIYNQWTPGYLTDSRLQLDPSLGVIRFNSESCPLDFYKPEAIIPCQSLFCVKHYLSCLDC